MMTSHLVLSRGRGRAGTTERIVGTAGRVNTGGKLGGGGRHAGHCQEEDEGDGDHAGGGGGWTGATVTTLQCLTDNWSQQHQATTTTPSTYQTDKCNSNSKQQQ